MRRYLLLCALLFALFLGLFGLAQALDLAFLKDPSPLLEGGGLWAAALSAALLALDLFLPIPSSLVMIANGALFGAPLGAVVSLGGGLSAALLGFGVGRRGGPWLSRWLSQEERAAADRLLGGWGFWAIALSRPVPLLSEVVILAAGASPVGWGAASLASLLGLLPASLLYALAGANATSPEGGALVFVGVVLLASLAWVVGRLARRGGEN